MGGGSQPCLVQIQTLEKPGSIWTEAGLDLATSGSENLFEHPSLPPLDEVVTAF